MEPDAHNAGVWPAYHAAQLKDYDISYPKKCVSTDEGAWGSRLASASSVVSDCKTVFLCSTRVCGPSHLGIDLCAGYSHHQLDSDVYNWFDIGRQHGHERGLGHCSVSRKAAAGNCPA